MSEEHREHPLPWAAEGANSPEASSAHPTSPSGDEMGAKDERDSGRAEPGQTQPEPQADAGYGEPPTAAGEGAQPTAAGQSWQPGAAWSPVDRSDEAGTVPSPPSSFVHAPAADLFAIPTEPVVAEIPQSAPIGEGAVGEPVAGFGETPDDAAEEVDGSVLVAAVLARRSDPRSRPADPAGTRPKFDPDSLVSKRALENPVLSTATEIVEDESTDDEHDEEDSHLLPVRRPSGGVGAPVMVEIAPYAPRFQFVKGALGAIAALAVVGLVVVLTGGSSHITGVSGPKWSSWAPKDNGVDPAVQIARHVAPEYRMDDGKQLVTITGGPPAYDGQSLVLALLQSGQQPTALSGNAVLYQLCGGGKGCAIKAGTPSAQRGLLLRREALELALYTFHYLSGVNEVVVTIPPSPTTSTSDAGQATSESVINRALYFKPSTVSAELSHTLSYTLPTPTPDVSAMNGSPNASLVANVTGNALYDFSIEQGDSTYVLVLTPPGIGG